MDIWDFVVEKFKNKVDKNGEPYFGHLKRVGDSSYYTCPQSEEEITKLKEVAKITDNLSIHLFLYDIGLLHDIFEDTDTTEEELLNVENVTTQHIEIIKILTRNKEKETYFQYIDRVSQNKVATLVKLADLKDNMDITRYDVLDDNAISLIKRYHKAFKILTKNYKKL